MIKGFVAYKSFLDKDLTTKDPWLAVTKEEFDEFRVSTTWFGMVNQGTGMLTPSRSSGAPSRVPDPVADFKKEIKRDITVFPALKQDKQFEAWHHSMMTHARAQNVDNILLSTYKPLIPAAKELFIEQQKYMCSVYERVLLTDKGKAIFRKHHHTSDAQQMNIDLLDQPLLVDSLY